jgi:hypothetical protein
LPDARVAEQLASDGLHLEVRNRIASLQHWPVCHMTPSIRGVGASAEAPGAHMVNRIARETAIESSRASAQACSSRWACP